MPTSKGHPRVVLQFNDFDFRHRKVLEILRSRPRNMTDLVVNAVMHYISCPDAGDEFGKEMVRKTVREVIFEMLADGSLSGVVAPQHSEAGLSKDDTAVLSEMMSVFR